MADFTAWEAYKAITVQDANVDGNLTDFPCLVVLAADGDVGGRSQAAGQDLRFTLSDGTTQLPHEIENFAIDGTPEANGNIWVKVPSIAASGGASIRIYYGNDGASDGQDTTNVWDANYLSVYHLSEGDSTAAGFYKDSTSNANHGTLTDANGNTVQADGKIYKGMDFFGDADVITATGFANANFTIQAWIKRQAGISGFEGIAGYTDASKVRHEVFLDNTGDVGMSAGGQFVASSMDVDDGNWWQVAAQWNGSTRFIFVNGASVGFGSTTPLAGATTASKMIIADLGGEGNEFNGVIDEVRFSDILRTANWQKFEYANINEADNELTIGAEVVQAAGNPWYYYANQQAAV